MSSYEGCHHEETSDFGNKNVTAIFYFTSAIYVVENICTKFEKNLSDFSTTPTDEGKVFTRIIERGIKLDRLDIVLTAGTGYGSLRN